MTTDRVDLAAPLHFLRTGYEPSDWIAVFLKSYDTGRTLQRVGPVSRVTTPRFQAWLRAENAAGVNVYVSINAVTPAHRSRRRDAIHAVRHLLLDIDGDAARVLATVRNRPDLPEPSYVVRSSVGRAQIFWRLREFTCVHAETLQKQLAREHGADPAATACSQTARLPGFFNHKYRPAQLVTAEYRDHASSYAPQDFPSVVPPAPSISRLVSAVQVATDRVERARHYVAAMPSAIAGRHGDLQTFRVCCRLVRGFALADAEALPVLTDWNARCEPPWSELELRDKLRRARLYGREPLGGLLEGQP